MAHRQHPRRRIIMLLGGSAALALVVFACWRALRGDWAAAGFDIVAAMALSAIVWMAHRGRQVDRAGLLLCIASTLLCIAGTVVVGPASYGWIYLALVSNFYIARARAAALSSGVLVAAASVSVLLSHPTVPVALTTIATWLLVAVFTYIFAFQVQLQQGSLEELAHVDPLTRLPNRRAMEQQLVAALVEHGPRPPGLLVIDIDRFKSVNDRFGHGAGDAVLEALARVLRDELRRLDRVFRFGGEEFVVLLPSANTEALVATAERMRAAVAAAVRSPGGGVTVSVGAALANGEADWQDWFSRADTALYEAKREGGDQVRLA